ncbi:MAG: glycosyltransferase [Leptolyngbya sp. DLM2.Bin27]|nr:MAG: glycosyltransferase [Leptolyngbya sp. DLM2.Bin27]
MPEISPKIPPRISVVIPAYNAEKTIKFTLESVLSQTYSDFELIIINDGSQDATLSIINQFKDRRVRVFSHENSGPQKSRNRGINQATGEYISFIDADDLWTPDKLEQQLKRIEANPEVSVVYSWSDEINEHGMVTRSGQRSTLEGKVFEALLKNNFLGSGSNPLIRKQALSAVGGFDPSILAGQDWDMWLTLASDYTFAVVPQVQVFYRKSAGSKSWSSNLSRQEQGLRQVMAKHLSRRSDLLPSRRAYLAFCYRYLLFECFGKCAPSFSNGMLSLRFFGVAVYLEPGWWMQRSHLIGIVLAKTIRYLLAFVRFAPG